jgi:HlyD family secretion protein
MLISYIIFVGVTAGSVFYYKHSEPPQAPQFVATATSASSAVTASGTVSPVENPNLPFLSGGRVASVSVVVGQHVTKGTVLAKLDTSSLQAAVAQATANLKSAEANLALQRAKTENTTVNIDQVKQEQNTLVANARRTMLSEGLTAVPDSSNYDLTAPTISGQYDGPEGTYKIVIRHSTQPTVDDHLIQTFGLETTTPILISKTGEATKLGTHGLYISFSDLLVDYDNTTWYVTIPNTESSPYLSNYNAYQSALQTRDKAIADATAELNASSDTTSVSSAQIQSAEAAVDSAKANLAAAQVALQNAIITAPFDGTVTAIRVKVGDTASPNEPAVSLSPDSALQVDTYLSELAVARIAVGDPVDITLDAYGDGRVYAASVVSIDRSPTTKDGAPAYKTTIQFATSTPEITAGMTANVTIHPTDI